MNQLDKMAKGLALSVNAIHSGSMDSNIKDTTKTLDFFVASDGKDEAGISAKNISINALILEDSVQNNSGEANTIKSADLILGISSLNPSFCTQGFP